MAALIALLYVAFVSVTGVDARNLEFDCPGSSDAIAASQSAVDVSVQPTKGIGYAFLGKNVTLSPVIGGPNVSRGIVILPEEGVAPEAYAPIAREVALFGYYAVIVEKATSGRTVRAMMQQPHLQYWTLAGHGKGGAIAAQLALTLHPKVKALILLAAPVPKNVDLVALNILVVVLYGIMDSVVRPATVKESFTRLPGDSDITAFPHLGHYDFASSTCVGNDKGQNETGPLDQTNEDFDTIVSKCVRALGLSHWAVAGEKALSFSDNEKLTPGHNDSKPYPGDIRVQCTKVSIPNTSPQRYWWVFRPTDIKGGLVYYPGAAVDPRAYFPVAFQIAARGHLVVIVQVPQRIASNTYQDASTVIDSKHPLFSGVRKGKWAIGGHSAGAYAATLYANEFGERIYAAVLHAGGWGANLTTNPLPVINIYGTLDDLTPGGYDRYRYLNTDPPPKGRGPLVNLDTSQFVPIVGANHYQVGDYGYQNPDQIPTISVEQQSIAFAIESVKFLENCISGSWLHRKRPQENLAVY